MVLVKEKKIKAKRIDEKHLVKTWKTLSRKPLPKIKALKLRDEDFNYVIEHRRCLEDDLREIDEWGGILSPAATDACVFNADETEEAEYIIVVRENPFHSLDEIIFHELSHIAKCDL